MATSQATAAQRLAAPLPQNKFGILRPLTTDQARDIQTGTGDDLLASRVEQILGSAGEFPWRPELNAQLDKVRNVRDTNALADFCRYYIGQILSRFLPEVTAVDVVATRNADGRRLDLVVTCTRTSDLNLKPAKTFDVTISV